jgi:periplasmic protein CpxP/Spy
MKMLKYLLLMLALATPAALLAQDQSQGQGSGAQTGQGQGQGSGAGQMAHHMPSVDDQLDHLSSKLNLTDAQKPQVKTVLQDQQDQMAKLMSSNSGSHEDMHAKMRDIHEKSNAKIRAILTDDQKAQFDKMQSEHHGHMGHGGDQGAPPPPPQQ